MTSSSEIVRLLGKAIAAHEDLAESYRELGWLADAKKCDDKVKAFRKRTKAIMKQLNDPFRKKV